MILGVTANRIRDELGQGDEQGAVPSILRLLAAASQGDPGRALPGGAPWVWGHRCGEGEKGGGAGAPGQQS